MSKYDNVFYILIPFLTLGIPMHYSIFPICLALLILRCISSERTTVAAFLMLYAGPTIGCIRSIYPFLPVYGLMFSVIGLLLVTKEFKGFFKKNRTGLFSLALIFGYFCFSLIYGGFIEEGQNKFYGIINNGISSFLGFYILFRSSKIRNDQFAQMLLITSILMTVYILTFYGFSAGNILDFNWFREVCTIIENTQEHKIIGYQHIGMNTAFALGILFSKKRLATKESIYYCIMCMWLTLMTGARQAMLAVVAIIALRYCLFGNSGIYKVKLKYIALSILFLAFIYNLAYYLNIEVITQTIEEGDTGRNLLKIQALSIFSLEPFFGQGLGGFYKLTGEDYPHNFFLEILCECGLIGAIYFTAVCFSYIKHNRIRLYQQTANNSLYIIMMIALTIRCMVSGNFTISIQLFSALFALSSHIVLNKRFINHEQNVL